MLLLGRKRGERIRIEDSVEVTVLAISGSRVKLGFSGPPDVWSHREEVTRQAKKAGPVASAELSAAAR
jgi:carbon storage regulator CsrA